ncbi:hypothetical protein [Effusibacillus lacus]|uniref:Uncharacterized protein n=1 Tax=Effusibacillus lacus TaxID=1348429 RepID=A0A292YI72_9BACL|nr:hypothetical protein [Effusibacillus lacus]TCS74727.1 hypothetical protein EDD64_11116 [Effusibacillus lacus]GAX88539.1 hypothetical protein EFBL_0151 [Effusibacillus lacus]
MVSGYMLYALWLVLAAIGLNVLLGVFQSLRAQSFSVGKFTNFLKSGILFSVLPLLIVAHMMPLDPTGWILKIAYYAGAIGVFLNYMMDVFAKIKK